MIFDEILINADEDTNIATLEEELSKMSGDGSHYAEVVIYRGEEETRLLGTYRFADGIVDALIEQYGAENVKTNTMLTDGEHRIMRHMNELYCSAEQSTQKNLELILTIEEELKGLRSMFAEFIQERNQPLSERGKDIEEY